MKQGEFSSDFYFFDFQVLQWRLPHKEISRMPDLNLE